jgi:DNA-directed RNA polymerase subunit RPC12/RpoP
MSEFKYACPYCGQHIKCDSSQSGSVMDCPTCLQKIIAPQAPADADQKFILSGKKLDDRPKVPLAAGASSVSRPPRRSFPVAALALVVLIGASVTAALEFRDKLFHFGNILFPAAPPPSTVTKPAPPVVAPPANGTNWVLNLETMNFPDTPAAGRIHGQDFLSQRAYLQNGALTLRAGTKGSVEFGLVINFSGAQPNALAGKTINITSNAPIAARVTLRWKETDQVVKDNFETGYALRLEFGPLAGNHLPGKIYFCAPDDAKSYVAGTFVADIRKPKAAKP